MREVNVGPFLAIHADALDTALRLALAGKMLGLSSYGPERLISIWLDDSATDPDVATAEAIAAAHDPVFLSLDKPEIIADGLDIVTVTIHASTTGAPVLLQVADAVVGVILTAGVGSVTISSADPAAIPVSVQNSANRTTDAFSILAG